MNWADSDNEVIKYYSGTAVYTTEFTLDAVPAGKDMFINLGQVHVMAEVVVNGKRVGGTWMYPYVLNVGDFVKPGKNTLEIKAVSLWRNALIKDLQLPAEKRRTWLVVNDLKPNEPLQPSGLVGPVVLETIEK